MILTSSGYRAARLLSARSAGMHRAEIEQKKSIVTSASRGPRSSRVGPAIGPARRDVDPDVSTGSPHATPAQRIPSIVIVVVIGDGDVPLTVPASATASFHPPAAPLRPAP